MPQGGEAVRKTVDQNTYEAELLRRYDAASNLGKLVLAILYPELYIILDFREAQRQDARESGVEYRSIVEPS